LSETRVAVIEDEQSVRQFLEVALSSQGYSVVTAASGRDGIAVVSGEKPDLIVLDLGLPDIDGVEVTRQLRESTGTPIIILSVRGSESDKITALDAGADDYLTKPFGVGELLARLRAASRRTHTSLTAQTFSSGDLSIDLGKRVVTRDRREIQLTPTEYELLRSLVARAGMVVTRRQLLLDVWGPAYKDENHMLHVNMSNLRGKIELDPATPRLIVTEPGVGYRLRESP
jgi:two-component system KDP operon response regulator KdpE